MDPSKLEYLNKNHLMETWSQPHGLNALADRVAGLVKETFPDRYACAPRTSRPQPGTHVYTSEYTTVDHIKQVILALQVYYHPDWTEELLNLANRVGLPTSWTFQNLRLTSLSNLTTDHRRRSPWSSPFLRLTSVGGHPFDPGLLVDVGCVSSKNLDQYGPKTRIGRVLDGG